MICDNYLTQQGCLFTFYHLHELRLHQMITVKRVVYGISKKEINNKQDFKQTTHQRV